MNPILRPLRCAALALLAGAAGCEPPLPPVAAPVEVPPAERRVEVTENEAEPSLWVARLDAPATRAGAVDRLVQLYEDRMAQDQGAPRGPQVKQFLDLVVEPLTRRCVAADLDERTGAKVLKLLSAARDPRAEPCFVKTLADYQVDRTEEQVGKACRAVAALKLKGAAPALMEVFSKLHASRPRAQATYRDVHDAMLAIPEPGWAPDLIDRIGRATDMRDRSAFTDEMFWQITSAELLGVLRSAPAVRPLLKMMLSPVKAAAQGDAVLALVKIGKPAIGPAVALLRGEDAELVAYSRDEISRAAPGDKNAEKSAVTAHVGAAALVLATLGREEASAPLVETLGKTKDLVTRVIIARELTKVRRSPRTIKAFRQVYEAVPVTLSLPYSRGSAREALLDVAPNFFDASLVPWIAGSLKAMRGDASDLEPIRERAMEAMIKLATRDQLHFIDDLARSKTSDGSSLGKGYAKEIELAKELLGQCADRLDCYLHRLTDPQVNTDAYQSIGIKSAYQIGVIGAPDVGARIMEVFPGITHPAVRFAALTVLDALSPRGDAAIAERLQKIVDDAVASGDVDRRRFNPTLKQFIYRLRARAEP